MSACGTLSAYQRHRRNGEDADPACKAAHAAYIKAWRAKNGRSLGDLARARALTRLAQAHRDEYRELYADELGRERRAVG